MNDKNTTHDNSPRTTRRFSNLYFQLIAISTAILPLLFGSAGMPIRIALFFIIWWGWLSGAQLMPAIPEFQHEKTWLRELWRRGGTMRVGSCIATVLYFHIFLPKILYFWAAITAAIIYYIAIY